MPTPETATGVRLLPQAEGLRIEKDSIFEVLPFEFGAGKRSRTVDLNLGKVALYQLSYSREETNYSRIFCQPGQLAGQALCGRLNV
jgi:hypothetical protein